MSNKEEKDVKQLSDLIMQTLETSGQLASVKAMIRQQVFNVVNDEQPLPTNPKDKKDKYQLSSSSKKAESKLHMSNKAVQNALKNEDEKLTLMLVKELLDYYSMDYTQNIFSSESNLQDSVDRNNLASKTKTNKSDKKPLLVQIVQNAISGKGISSAGGNQDDSASTAAPSTSKQFDSKSASSMKQKEEPAKNFQKKETATNKYSSTKFDNIKNVSNQYEQNDIEESMGGFDQISDEEDDYKPTSKQGKGKTLASNTNRKNPMFSSMEDTIGASMSHGQDQSVDSMQLEEDYDYHEQIS